MFSVNTNLNNRANRIKYKRNTNRKKIKYLILGIIVLLIIQSIISITSVNESNLKGKKHFSEEVLNYKPTVQKYAKEYNISEYTDYLLAIIQVESGGVKEDVMQSSESLDLKPNSLSSEQSINQGCKYFSELVLLAKNKGCDLKSVIQSYNFGKGFLDYVAQKGDKYSFDIAKDYAEINSKDEKVQYNNPIAVKVNSGWRYKYGNMFYVDIINQYVDFNV